MRTTFAARLLSDLLALRDCRFDLRATSAVQEDFFAAPQRAACPRYDFGTCRGRASARVSTATPRELKQWLRFCEGRVLAPIDRVILEMGRQAEAGNFDAAIRWREKLEGLEWLLSAAVRARNTMDLLTFAYRDPGPAAMIASTSSVMVRCAPAIPIRSAPSSATPLLVWCVKNWRGRWTPMPASIPNGCISACW